VFPQYSLNYSSTLKLTLATNYRLVDRETSSLVAKVLTISGEYEGEGQGGGREQRRPKSFPVRRKEGGDGRASNIAGMHVERDATRRLPRHLLLWSGQEIRERGTRARAGKE